MNVLIGETVDVVVEVVVIRCERERVCVGVGLLDGVGLIVVAILGDTEGRLLGDGVNESEGDGLRLMDGI